MIELTRENWQTEVLAKAKLNQSGALAEHIKTHRHTLLATYQRPKNKYDNLDVMALSSILGQGLLDKSSIDTLNGLSSDLERDLLNIYELTNACLNRINKLQVPDTGKLRDLINYL